MIADYTSALQDGPWRHEFVPANGCRFHVATAEPAPVRAGEQTAQPSGEQGASTERRPAPLVVLLHSFPQFWWAWRLQIPALAAAGFRVAALDLRGTGGSDKPPLGYDVPMRTRDVAGVIRSLGAESAYVVGHGTGAAIAWACAAYQPRTTAGVVALSAPHPARRRVAVRRALTPSAARHIAFAQLPTLPERALTRGTLVADLLTEGSVAPVPPEAVATYRTALQIPFAAHSAMEALRWSVRSAPTPGGARYVSTMRRPVDVPALQLQGELDPWVRGTGAATDAADLARTFRLETIPGAGHFLPEEAPDAVSEALVSWLSEVRRS
ncbi:alpha/beta hydrolase [Paraoerskovia sediminicola]|uniref:Alpha/beta hydrolase n=1 Tax=Paraoerskovia sediminicola TaxID=1138587 RepID=A0ABM8G344_9CELL|nr:alpha/beta hydrolase [Paraoerskovia sediminicola]BDZ42558.1 alpha/beta hydrolase [Paraoerskovia sediminicola]